MPPFLNDHDSKGMSPHGSFHYNLSPPRPPPASRHGPESIRSVFFILQDIFTLLLNTTCDEKSNFASCLLVLDAEMAE